MYSGTDGRSEAAMDSSDISSDLSSQQLLVNQLRDRLKQNESLLKGRESEFTELQQKFNKLKFIHKSKTSVTSTPPMTISSELTPTTATSSPQSSDDRAPSDTTTPSPLTTGMTTSMTASTSDSANRGKFLLLKKQLEESRALNQLKDSENQMMKHELQELRDRQIKYEEERDDQDVE
ncbi:unnamed protein product, partial [Oppiella nova]